LATYRNPLWHYGEFRKISSKYADIVAFFQKSSLIALYLLLSPRCENLPQKKNTLHKNFEGLIYFNRKSIGVSDLTAGFNVLSPKTKGPNAEIGILSCENWHLCQEQGPVVGPYLHIVVVVTIYPLAHR
jgi:hypothetical protein